MPNFFSLLRKYVQCLYIYALIGPGTIHPTDVHEARDPILDLKAMTKKQLQQPECCYFVFHPAVSFKPSSMSLTTNKSNIFYIVQQGNTHGTVIMGSLLASPQTPLAAMFTAVTEEVFASISQS